MESPGPRGRDPNIKLPSLSILLGKLAVAPSRPLNQAHGPEPRAQARPSPRGRSRTRGRASPPITLTHPFQIAPESRLGLGDADGVKDHVFVNARLGSTGSWNSPGCIQGIALLRGLARDTSPKHQRVNSASQPRARACVSRAIERIDRNSLAHASGSYSCDPADVGTRNALAAAWDLLRNAAISPRRRRLVLCDAHHHRVIPTAPARERLQDHDLGEHPPLHREGRRHQVVVAKAQGHIAIPRRRPRSPY